MNNEPSPPQGDGRHEDDLERVKDDLLRPVALFLDGMFRAAILSFGPSLVYRLMFGTRTGKLGLNCSIVAYPLAIVVAAFLVGRLLGSSLAWKRSICHNRLPRHVARLAGIAIALHVFTFGAGLTSWWWLVIIRFLSGILIGALCGITRPTQQFEEEEIESDIPRVETGTATQGSSRRHGGYFDIASGTTKIYMTSFAVSIITGGLLYRHATGDATFKALTNSNKFTLSPIFLVGVSITAECILRFAFHLLGKELGKRAGVSRPISIYKQPSALSTTSNEADEMFDAIDQSHLLTFHTPMKATDLYREIPDKINPLSAAASLESPRNSSSFAAFRTRLETSDSDFFDCNSVFSDMEDMPVDDLSDGSNNRLDNPVALYQDRRCVFADGTPAFVPQGDRPDVVPSNYIEFCGGKALRAQEMWRKSQTWRREHDIWKIHSMPNQWFEHIKQAYPHYLHGVSKQGYAVIYEQPGKMNLKELFRSGCDVSDMLRHYAFFMEYICHNVCTRQEVRAKLGPEASPHSSSSWGFMVVLDVKGAGISHLSGDVLMYLKGAGDLGSAHYPLNMKRAFLVNSPFWLAGVWSNLKGILPDSVQVDILSSGNYASALKEFIDEDQIPVEYGGSSQYALSQHPFELGLTELVNEANSGRDTLEESPNDSVTAYDHATNGYSASCDRLAHNRRDPYTTNSAWRSPDSQRPLRRRGVSFDQPRSVSVIEAPDDGFDDPNDKNAKSDTTGIFIIVSIMQIFWSAMQGVIETAIPLWILTPTPLGGLGYAPSRSGVAMFCSAMVLLWVMRTKVSPVISKIQIKAPMRSFRIGVGAQSVLLLLLATVPKSISPAKRTDSVLIMTFTIIIISCTVLSGLLGRSASTILHRIASGCFAQIRHQRRIPLPRQYSMGQLMEDCKSGRLTYNLNVCGEILGALSVGPICAWSLSHERPAPFDGTSCLFISSLVSLVLYVCSFSVHLNVVGEFAPHPRNDGCSDIQARRCGSFLLEVLTVSVGDMSSLLEEANWSVTPLLGNARSYTQAHPAGDHPSSLSARKLIV